MKKLLFALGAISLTAVASTSVVACSSGVSISKLTVADQSLAADTTKKNSDVATDATILSAIDAAFKASTDATIKVAVINTDYTVTAKSPDTAQAAAAVVELTVKGKGKLSGSFTVKVTLT